MGFSPPNHGCHKSGLRKRMKSRRAKNIQNNTSSKSNKRHRSLIKILDSFHFSLDINNEETSASMAIIARMVHHVNAARRALAIIQVPHEIISRPSALLKI